MTIPNPEGLNGSVGERTTGETVPLFLAKSWQ